MVITMVVVVGLFEQLGNQTRSCCHRFLWGCSGAKFLFLDFSHTNFNFFTMNKYRTGFASGKQQFIHSKCSEQSCLELTMGNKLRSCISVYISICHCICIWIVSAIGIGFVSDTDFQHRLLLPVFNADPKELS